MSYGTNFVALFRHVAVLVDKILKGAKPADLPAPRARGRAAGLRPLPGHPGGRTDVSVMSLPGETAAPTTTGGRRRPG